MRDRVGEAVRRARNESIPTLIEIRTYRFRGHSMSDPELYRNKTEVEHWREMDPIVKFSTSLLAAGAIDQAEIDRINDSVEHEVEECAVYAEESPFPEVSTLTNHVYAPSPLDGLSGQGGNTHA